MAEGSSKFRPQKPIFCNRCGYKTTHNLKGEQSRDLYGDHPLAGPLYEETEVYLFWVCAGCGQGTLEMASINRDDIDDSGYHRYFSGRYYPKRSEHEAVAKRFKKLPERLDQMYRETIHAFNANLYLLCAAGLRSLVEGICDERGIKSGTLAARIDAMKEILPEDIVEKIHGFNAIGIDAVHYLTPYTREELLPAIEGVEVLLSFLLEFEDKVGHLPRDAKRKRADGKVIKLQDRKDRDK